MAGSRSQRRFEHFRLGAPGLRSRAWWGAGALGGDQSSAQRLLPHPWNHALVGLGKSGRDRARGHRVQQRLLSSLPSIVLRNALLPPPQSFRRGRVGKTRLLPARAQVRALPPELPAPLSNGDIASARSSSTRQMTRVYYVTDAAPVLTYLALKDTALHARPPPVALMVPTASVGVVKRPLME